MRLSPLFMDHPSCRFWRITQHNQTFILVEISTMCVKCTHEPSLQSWSLDPWNFILAIVIPQHYQNLDPKSMQNQLLFIAMEPSKYEPPDTCQPLVNVLQLLIVRLSLTVYHYQESTSEVNAKLIIYYGCNNKGIH